MPGIRIRMRGSSLVEHSQGNGNNVELSTETENRTTQSFVRNVISLQSKVFSRADSLDSCNAFPCLPKQAAAAKVSRLGRAGSFWFEKAVEILITVGSRVMDLNNSGSFTTGVTVKDNKIAILAFEVGNTIIKGAKLMDSLSENGLESLKSDRLQSTGVKMLVTEDMDELLRIAEADKREELEKFSREVIRLGNYCKDPQWHNLDRYFKKSELDRDLTQDKCLNAESTIQHLMTLVKQTAELFKELLMFDKVEQDYREKLKEDGTNVAQRVDIASLRAELETQRKLIISLKKKSLWSRNLEEVIKSLVDIVQFLNLKLRDAFGSADCYQPLEGSQSNNNRLGPTGIALNYAHIIRQIDILVSLSSPVPKNVKDDLYQRLPKAMKSALSTKLRSFHADDNIPQIRANMEKTLQWLAPMARNTTNDLQGFGWVREWENAGSEVSLKRAGHSDITRIETLYHADKEKTEACIFELLVWLHHLISQPRTGNVASSSGEPDDSPSKLTLKDHEMLEDVGKKISTPGISKSQNFDISKTKLRIYQRLTKSSRESPTSETNNCSGVRWLSCSPVIDFDIDRNKALDVIDGLGTA